MSTSQSDLTIYVDLCRRMLALSGHYLDRDSKILDFGCGAGKFVYQFRDAGFDARGFDIHDYLELRSSGDRQYFQIANGISTDSSIMLFDWEKYRLPYEDDSFDFIFSFQTLEHVLDLDTALRELARVMKPSGVAIHIFPSRYRYLESHTNIPFGGMTKSYWYNYFWAAIGIRNEFQKGFGPAETAKLNSRYAQTGTNYPSILQIRAIGRKYYDGAHFAPEFWHAAWGNYGWRLMRPALLAFTLFDEIVWLLERPRKFPAVPERDAALSVGEPDKTACN